MFGAVPKTIWSKNVTADQENRILLGLNCLLVRDGKQNILIDTGIGNKFSKKLAQIYVIDKHKNLLDSLAPFCSPQDIDYVIFTHLHLDHCGGSSFYNDKGELALTFPNAHYVVQKAEWAVALDPDDKSRPSYLPENIQPLANSGRLQLIEGDYQFNENIELLFTASHSPGHQAVKVTSGGETVFFGGDLFPTSHHIKPNYLTAYDMAPLQTIECKKKFLETAANENWLFVWEHNPKRALSKISKEEDKYKFVPL